MVRSVVTISRRSGSGGREIGQMLSERLAVPFYDRNLIGMAAEEAGIHASVVEQVDEKIARKVHINRPEARGLKDLDQIFFFAEEAVRNAAKKPCIIVGRCADYILREQPDVLRLFIYADMETRKRHFIERHGVEPKEVDAVIRRLDKERAAYYNYYTDYTWGSIDQYDLCINTSAMSTATAVDLIEAYVQLHEK